MFRPKAGKPKFIERQPSRGPAAYDSRPIPPPMRPTSINRSLSNAQPNTPAIEPNTLVVAVDFGKESPPNLSHIPSVDRTLANEIDRDNFHRYACFNPLLEDF